MFLIVLWDASLACSKYFIFCSMISVLISWFFWINYTFCLKFYSTMWRELTCLWSVLIHSSIAAIEWLWFYIWKFMFLRIFSFWVIIPSIFSSICVNFDCDSMISPPKYSSIFRKLAVALLSTFLRFVVKTSVNEGNTVAVRETHIEVCQILFLCFRSTRSQSNDFVLDEVHPIFKVVSS